MGHRQDEPGDRVVQGARPPGARAPRRTGRRCGGHVLHRELRAGDAPGASRPGPGAVAAVAPPRVHQEGPSRPLPQRGRPREGAGPHGGRARPLPPRPPVHRRPAGARRTASSTSGRRSAIASSAWRSTRRRATRTGTRPSPTRCSPSTSSTSPASRPATRSSRCSTSSAPASSAPPEVSWSPTGRVEGQADQARALRGRGARRPGDAGGREAVGAHPEERARGRPGSRRSVTSPADLGPLHLQDPGGVQSR